MSDTDALRAVMEADRWIDRVSTNKTHLPELLELTTLEQELRGLLKDLQEAEAALAPVRRRVDESERDAARLRTRAHDLEVTLDASTANARELTALQSEVAHVRQLLAASEDQELEALVELEPLEARVAQIKALAQPGVIRRGELRDAVMQLQASLDEELAALRADRVPIVERVPGPLRARYEAALARAGTSGAALVVEGRCDGCRLALSPLDLDRFKALPPETFMDCPECGRILVP